MLAVVTPVRGTNPKTAHVSLGFADFRASIVQAGYARVVVSYEPVRARNRLAAIVLQDMPTARAVLWLDDDQSATDPKIIQKMLDTGEDLVGAPYVKKDYPLEFAHVALQGATRKTDLLEVAGLGFGFTLTSRRCLEEMTRHARIYKDKPHSRKVADLFGLLYEGPSENDTLLSEDLSFCSRWKSLGHRCVLYCGGPGTIHHYGGHTFYATNVPE